MKEKGSHETLLGRAQPLRKVSLPLSGEAPAPGPSRVSTWEKATCKVEQQAHPWMAPRMAALPKAGSPLPCSTMRGMVHRAEIPGSSRQSKEAGASLDQVGTTKH